MSASGPLLQGLLFPIPPISTCSSGSDIRASPVTGLQRPTEFCDRVRIGMTPRSGAGPAWSSALCHAPARLQAAGRGVDPRGDGVRAKRKALGLVEDRGLEIDLVRHLQSPASPSAKPETLQFGSRGVANRLPLEVAARGYRYALNPPL